jgi:hypothetical protein
MQTGEVATMQRTSAPPAGQEGTMNENAPTKTVLRHLQELDGRIVYLDAVLATLILRCECIEARLADLAKKRTRQ